MTCAASQREWFSPHHSLLMLSQTLQYNIFDIFYALYLFDNCQRTKTTLQNKMGVVLQRRSDVIPTFNSLCNLFDVKCMRTRPQSLAEGAGARPVRQSKGGVQGLTRGGCTSPCTAPCTTSYTAPCPAPCPAATLSCCCLCKGHLKELLLASVSRSPPTLPIISILRDIISKVRVPQFLRNN